jgi:hypothetical protein
MIDGSNELKNWWIKWIILGDVDGDFIGFFLVDGISCIRLIVY